MKKQLLVIGPLPPPVTGHSLACLVLTEELKRQQIEFASINLSKPSLRSGNATLGRVIEVLGIIAKVLKYRFFAQKFYLTVSESVFGNIKDILIYCALLGRLRSTYIHLHGGGGMRELLSERHPVLRAINAFFIRRLAGVVVLGSRHADIYSPIISPERLKIVKNFAPDEVFVSCRQLRSKYNNTSKLKILYLSNLLPGKGYEDLLTAFSLLSHDVRGRAELIFAGNFQDDGDRKNFEEAVSKVEGVQYLGPARGELKQSLLAEAHIFCMPAYLPEGQPISILEAYAAGCAVVTTDVGGIFDIFVDRVNGYAAARRDPASIANAISRLWADKQALRRIMVRNARLARSQYRRDHHLTSLLKALEMGR